MEERTTGCLVILALIIGLAAISSAVVMWLWNWLMPSLFGLPLISFWQAFGLMLLFNFLVGGRSGSSSSSSRSRR